MKLNKNIVFYLFAIAIFVILKLVFANADINNMLFLIEPTNRILELLLNSNSEFIADTGFFHQNLNIMINKSCSGFNFWLMSFIMLSFLFIKHSRSGYHKIIAMPAILILTYVLTIFVNSSRLITSIIFEDFIKTNITFHIPRLHEIEGAFIYLFFLIIIYLTTEYLLKTKYKTNEKPIES